MSNLYRLVGFALLGLLLASCSAQKRVWYLQDVQSATPEQIVQNGEIRIKPLDRLIVVVNSKDPELAVPFNSSTAMNSLSANGPSSFSNIESLQTRTVDENGCILMPIIGTVKCEGLTRNELARLIADKIVEGGYINDPSVNVQFSDMKFSVIGEVAHPGSFEIDRDGITYTIDTLGELERRWPDVRFAMLVGTDIVGQIERWKQWEEIVSRYKIYVYPRRGYAGDGDARFEALAGEPFEDFSSTEVRRALASGDTDMVPEAVRNYIKEHKLWITQKKSPD